MIYVLNTNVIIPGKLAEHSEIVAKEMVPIAPKIGLKWAGSFHGYTGDMNVSYGLFVYDDLTAMQKAIELRQKDKDNQRISTKLNALRVSVVNTILEPNPWSPMK
jgi:hypothetical protein